MGKIKEIFGERIEFPDGGGHMDVLHDPKVPGTQDEQEPDGDDQDKPQGMMTKAEREQYAKWEESDHPRDESGQFGSGGGGGAGDSEFVSQHHPGRFQQMTPEESDARSEAEALDMDVDWKPSSPGTKPPLIVPAPRDGETWFHGGNPNPDPSRPTFLTREKSGAEWYAVDRGGSVSEMTLDAPRFARNREFMDVVKSVGATEDDIQAHSPYGGGNELDFVYVPAVADELKRRGFNSVLTSDVLSNDEIETLVLLPGWDKGEGGSLVKRTEKKSQGISGLESTLLDKHQEHLDALVLSEGKDYVKLHTIRMKEGSRGRGTGSTIIRELQEYAEQQGKPIVLEARAEPRKKKALDDFYRSHGFRRPGRSRDYSLPANHTHIWLPKFGVTLNYAKWEESDHPRDESGQFGSGGGTAVDDDPPFTLKQETDIIEKQPGSDPGEKKKQGTLFEGLGEMPGQRDWIEEQEERERASAPPPPTNEADYLSARELADELRANYFNEAGEKIASSRETPAKVRELPIGSWKISDARGLHGRDIEQLRMLNPSDLFPSEVTTREKAPDVARYRDWMKEGKVPPPISVVETESGELKIVDGHRRAAAAEQAGMQIPAWVSPSADHPEGMKDSEGNIQKVGLTYEMVEGEKKSPSESPTLPLKNKPRPLRPGLEDWKDPAVFDKYYDDFKHWQHESRENINRAVQGAEVAVFSSVDDMEPDGGFYLVAHKSTRHPGKWQLSRLIKNIHEEGVIPQSHSDHDTIEQAAHAAMGVSDYHLDNEGGFGWNLDHVVRPGEKISLPFSRRSWQEIERYAKFDESKHPRDESGKFGSGGGTATAEADKPKMQTKEEKKSTATSTPEFKNWFGDSKVVDESGKPLVLYHGTTEAFTDTQQFSPDGGLGSHFGTLDVASRFASPYPGTERGRLYPVFLSIQKPLRMQDKGSWSEFNIAETFVSQGLMSEAEMKEWKEGYDARWKAHDWSQPYPRHKETLALLDSRGFDGIDYVNRREVELPDDLKYSTSKLDALTDDEFLARVPAASYSYIAVRPEQIKSSFGNQGSFDPDDPRINYSKQMGLWDEGEHPRDADGKFGEGGGSTATQEKPRATKKKTRKPPTKTEMLKREVKYNRANRLSEKRDYLLGRATRDMRSRTPEKADAAAVMRLILETGMRPGYNRPKEEPSFGASTLQARHIDANGETTLKFVGKAQVEHEIKISDKPLAEFLKKRAAQVRKTGGEDAPLFNVRESQLLKYAKNISGGKTFKVKDYRTMHGTMAARNLMSGMPMPTSKKEYKEAVQRVGDHVASVLGNTRSVALQSYIDHRIFEDWKDGAGY